MEDSGLSAHILVDCTQDGVSVPTEYIKDNKIVLNISSGATNSLVIDLEHISFKARFGGVSQSIFVPILAVSSIYAIENGEGMFFEVKKTSDSAQQAKPNLTLLD